MKIKTDFVTNSSSSSYVIGTKNELTMDLLQEVFNTPKDSLFYQLAEQMIKTLIDRADEMTIEQVLKDYWVKSFEELPEEVQSIFNKGMRFYSGSVSNKCGGIEEALCDMNIKFESDDIVIYKDGGY